MPPAPLPGNEHERLAALRSYDVLDTACEAAYDNLVTLAAQITGCPIAAVSLVDVDRQWFKARYGLKASETPRTHAFCAHAILSPTPLIVSDAMRDPRFADSPLVTEDPGIRFYAGIPLVNQEGFALGALCVKDLEPRTIDDGHIVTLATLAQAVMSTLELRRAMRQMQHLAATDALTGISNRAAFVVALEKAISLQRRTGSKLGVAYLDLDGFKQVNDTEGHQAGDKVLREVATVLVNSVRQENLVARLGGDEFAVIFVGDNDENGTASERVRMAIQMHMTSRGRQVTASVGSVCAAAPPAGSDIALAEVDALMYQAKAAGKNLISHRIRRPDPVCDVGCPVG